VRAINADIALFNAREDRGAVTKLASGRRSACVVATIASPFHNTGTELTEYE
jgi:hypothetical protein